MPRQQSLIPLKTLLFSFHATNTIMISFLPLYLAFKGLNGTEIGWVLAVGPLASIISQPVWGYLSDKYKTVKWMIVICIIGLICSSLIFFQMEHLQTILLVGAILYFFSSPVGALADSLGQRQADDLNVSFGTIRTWGSLGFAVSALLIGELLEQIGIQYMVWPYVIIGSFALLISFRLADVHVDTTPIRLSDVRKLLHNKSFVIFLLLMMFLTITHRTNDSFIGLYMTSIGGSEKLVGLVWFVGVISEAAVFALGAFWFRKFPSLVFVIIAGLLYTIRWFLYATFADPIIIIILQVLHGLTFGVFYLAAFDFITRTIPKLLQSTGHLIFYSVFFGVSGIIGSVSGGFIFEHYSGNMLYFLNGCLALVGTISFVIFYVRQKRTAM